MRPARRPLRRPAGAPYAVNARTSLASSPSGGSVAWMWQYGILDIAGAVVNAETFSPGSAAASEQTGDSIVSAFTADETVASATAKCVTLANAWLGSGAAAGFTTWGQYHTAVNAVLTAFGQPTIANGDTGAQWLAKMNVLSNAKTVLAPIALAWWNAGRNDLIAVETGVSSFRDSYNAYDMVQAVALSQPLYSLTSFSGFPGLTADGLAQQLTLASQPFPSAAAVSTLRFVGDQVALAADATSRAGFSYGGVTINDSRTIGRNVVSAVNRGFGRTGSGASFTTVNGTTVDLIGRHFIRVLIGAAQTEVSVDLNTAVVGAVVPSTGTTRVRIFALTNTVVANFWSGQGRDWFVSGAETASQTLYADGFFNFRRAV